MIVAFIALVAGAIFVSWTKRKTEREMAAMHYWCNTGDIFHELRDDPFMTTEKWRLLLPLFDVADCRFAETHPYIKKFARYGDLVRQEINNSPAEEVSSS